MSDASSDEGEEEVAASPSSVSRNPIAADARSLLAKFCSKRSVSYEDFKQTWTQLQFSLVYW